MKRRDDIEFTYACEDKEECWAWECEEYDICRYCTRSKLNEDYSDRFNRWIPKE